MIDSAASVNYLTIGINELGADIREVKKHEQVHVRVANGSTIVSSHIGQITLPGCTKMNTHIFPNITESLISVSELVALKTRVIFDEKCVRVLNADDVEILYGGRDETSGLWTVDLTSLNMKDTTPKVVLTAIRLDSSANFVTSGMQHSVHQRFQHLSLRLKETSSESLD